mmetsp:Transcript_16165/g.56442  ORF Transcript_16165/g.56442 Transcript_16165/m.56442 type:complete len:261 (+) Transcript_16165:2017-2799(+)
MSSLSANMMLSEGPDGHANHEANSSPDAKVSMALSMRPASSSPLPCARSAHARASRCGAVASSGCARQSGTSTPFWEAIRRRATCHTSEAPGGTCSILSGGTSRRQASPMQCTCAQWPSSTNGKAASTPSGSRPSPRWHVSVSSEASSAWKDGSTAPPSRAAVATQAQSRTTTRSPRQGALKLDDADASAPSTRNSALRHKGCRSTGRHSPPKSSARRARICVASCNTSSGVGASPKGSKLCRASSLSVDASCSVSAKSQ